MTIDGAGPDSLRAPDGLRGLMERADRFRLAAEMGASRGLLELIERNARGGDRGAAFFDEFAAKQTAALCIGVSSGRERQ